MWRLFSKSNGLNSTVVNLKLSVTSKRLDILKFGGSLQVKLKEFNKFWKVLELTGFSTHQFRFHFHVGVLSNLLDCLMTATLKNCGLRKIDFS